MINNLFHSPLYILATLLTAREYLDATILCHLRKICFDCRINFNVLCMFYDLSSVWFKNIGFPVKILQCELIKTNHLFHVKPLTCKPACESHGRFNEFSISLSGIWQFQCCSTSLSAKKTRRWKWPMGAIDLRK